MKFKLFLTIRGPAGQKEVPNRQPIVECANLASLLDSLAQNLPSNPDLGIETVGIRIEPAEDATIL